MREIKKVQFNEKGIEEIGREHFGKNWPVVYLIENEKEMYIGQTTNLYNRTQAHKKNKDREKLKNVHLITDEEYNLSASTDIESLLIQHMSADDKYKLQNGNIGIKDHDYFDKEKYRAKFEILWEKLQEKKLVNNSLKKIKNSDIFKYSPYKALTREQENFVNLLLTNLKEKKGKNTYLVRGSAGTGKTILAIYLMKRLLSSSSTKNLKIGMVIPMQSLRTTIKKVFKTVDGLKPSMAIAPNDVPKSKFDILIVDEAHRLRRRKNLGLSYRVYDSTNKKLKLDKEGTQLDWILKSSKKQIFFYDKNQNVMPADVLSDYFLKLDKEPYNLYEQLRVQAGTKYIEFIDSIFDNKTDSLHNFTNYDFKIFNDAADMVKQIKNLNKSLGLCRLVAGYSWPWITKKDESAEYDIKIDDLRLKWNSVRNDWVNSKNSINEVGCIHTIQGYDLNYVGVILGKDIYYNTTTKRVEVSRKNYCDRNGYAGVDEKELSPYIFNIYKTLLTRGIKGTYIYVVDKNLRDFLQTKISAPQTKNEKTETRKFIPITDVFDKELFEKGIPVLAEVNAGEPLNIAEENLLGYIVDGENKKIKKDDLFAVRVDGDSMNEKEINGKKITNGSYALVKNTQYAENGNIILAIVNGNATIKQYYKKQNTITLRSISTQNTPDITITNPDPPDFLINGQIVGVI